MSKTATRTTIFIASGNPHKIKEIKAIFAAYPDLDIDFHSIQGMDIPEPDEPYNTFMENARYKAQYYAQFTNAPTLSEDAGLCIDALDGFPGVYTKNYVEECGGLDNCYATLEQMLKGKSDHGASFVCAAALYFPAEDRYITFEGKDKGAISFPVRGDQCFGFDPIFVPHGYTQTMAELGEKVKNQIGHRSIAMRGIAASLVG